MELMKQNSYTVLALPALLAETATLRLKYILRNDELISYVISRKFNHQRNIDSINIKSTRQLLNCGHLFWANGADQQFPHFLNLCGICQMTAGGKVLFCSWRPQSRRCTHHNPCHL